MTVIQTLIEVLNQIFLRAEVVVRVTERHARLLCYSAHRGLLVPALAKHLESSFKDQRLRLISFAAFAGGLCFTHRKLTGEPVNSGDSTDLVTVLRDH